MRYLMLVTLLLIAVPVAAQEEAITLSTPLPAKLAITDYRPLALTITVRPVPSIVVTVQATDETLSTFVYPCGEPCAFDTEAKVRTLITAFNGANLATRSLWRRIFDRLLLDFPERFPGGATVQ